MGEDTADFLHGLAALPFAPIAHEEDFAAAVGPVEGCDVAGAD